MASLLLMMFSIPLIFLLHLGGIVGIGANSLFTRFFSVLWPRSLDFLLLFFGSWDV